MRQVEKLFESLLAQSFDGQQILLLLQYGGKLQETLVFIIGLIIMVVFWIMDAQQEAGRFMPLAERFGGVYTPGRNFRTRHLTLPYRGYELVVELRTSKGNSASFIASLQIEDPHLSVLSLITNSVLKKALNLQEENRVLTGDDRFDFLFQVICEDEALAGKIFSKEVRKNLKSDLLYMPKFDMEPDYFEMTASYPPASFSRQKYNRSLEHFIETVLSILDSAWK